MHKIELSPDLIAVLKKERGGRLHVLDRIDPRRTAHIVIDLQNGFMEPGAPVEVPFAREIVTDVNAISRAVRVASGLNVFLRFTTPPDPSSWPGFYARLSPETAEFHREAFTPGAHYWQLWSGLDVAEGDLAVDKYRFGAFIPGTCDLHEVLQERGIDTLIITGTLSNCCCESTARDAMQLDYRIIFVADANAALTDAEHNATLHNMCFLFADVMNASEVVALLEASAAGEVKSAA